MNGPRTTEQAISALNEDYYAAKLRADNAEAELDRLRAENAELRDALDFCTDLLSDFDDDPIIATNLAVNRAILAKTEQK